MKIAFMVLLAIASLVLIVTVMLQDGSNSGLSGAISGGADQLFGKKKANGIQKLYKKATIVSAVVFIVCSVVLVILG